MLGNGKKKEKLNPRIESLIGASTVIEGDLHFSGGMRVDGVVNGNIVAMSDKPSTLVLSERAKVNGGVRVASLVTNGLVNGSIETSEYLELQGKSRVIGEVRYKTLEMQLGAVVEGQLVYTADASAADQDGEDEKVVPLKAKSNEK